MIFMNENNFESARAFYNSEDELIAAMAEDWADTEAEKEKEQAAIEELGAELYSDDGFAYDPDMPSQFDDFTFIGESEEYSESAQPVKEQPVTKQPVQEQPVKEQSVKEQSMKEQQINKQTEKEQTVQEQPVKEQSAQEQPVKEKPEQEQAAQEQSAEKERVKAQPLQEQPVKKQAVKESLSRSVRYRDRYKEQPIQEQSGMEEPLQEQPAQEQALQEQPVKDQTIQETDGNPPAEKSGPSLADAFADWLKKLNDYSIQNSFYIDIDSESITRYLSNNDKEKKYLPYFQTCLDQANEDVKELEQAEKDLARCRSKYEQARKIQNEESRSRQLAEIKNEENQWLDTIDSLKGTLENDVFELEKTAWLDENKAEKYIFWLENLKDMGVEINQEMVGWYLNQADAGMPVSDVFADSYCMIDRSFSRHIEILNRTADISQAIDQTEDPDTKKSLEKQYDDLENEKNNLLEAVKCSAEAMEKAAWQEAEKMNEAALISSQLDEQLQPSVKQDRRKWLDELSVLAPDVLEKSKKIKAFMNKVDDGLPVSMDFMECYAYTEQAANRALDIDAARVQCGQDYTAEKNEEAKARLYTQGKMLRSKLDQTEELVREGTAVMEKYIDQQEKKAESQETHELRNVTAKMKVAEEDWRHWTDENYAQFAEEAKELARLYNANKLRYKQHRYIFYSDTQAIVKEYTDAKGKTDSLKTAALKMARRASFLKDQAQTSFQTVEKLAKGYFSPDIIKNYIHEYPHSVKENMPAKEAGKEDGAAQKNASPENGKAQTQDRQAEQPEVQTETPETSAAAGSSARPEGIKVKIKNAVTEFAKSALKTQEPAKAESEKKTPAKTRSDEMEMEM